MAHSNETPASAGGADTQATRGGGPLYLRFGNKPLYRWDDALAWAQSRLSASARSTSEHAPDNSGRPFPVRWEAGGFAPPKCKGRRTAVAMRTTIAALRQTFEPFAKRDVQLFAETAQLLIEAGAGMTHAVRMGACHYRTTVQTVKELACQKEVRS
jgi:hypothetical protein